MTKDIDFVLLQERLGAPPALLWVSCGNTSNAHLKQILRRTFANARKMVESGEILVEITDSP